MQYCTTVVGFSLLSRCQNTYSGFFFVNLKDWEERKSPEEQYEAIMAHAQRRAGEAPEGSAFAFPPPAIPGIGTSGGFTFVLEDRAGKDLGFLAQNLEKFLDAARKRPELASRAHDVSADTFRRSTRTWTGTRCSSRGSTWATSTRPCRPSWAG